MTTKIELMSNIYANYIGLCPSFSKGLIHEVFHHYKYGMTVIDNNKLGYMTVPAGKDLRLGDGIIYCKETLQIIENIEYKMKWSQNHTFSTSKSVEKWGHLDKIDWGFANYANFERTSAYVQNVNLNLLIPKGTYHPNKDILKIVCTDLSDMYSPVENQSELEDQLNIIFNDISQIYKHKLEVYNIIQENNIDKIKSIKLLK